MHDVAPTPIRPVLLTLAAFLGASLAAAPLTAQQAYTYTVRNAGGGYHTGGAAPDSFDFAADRNPLQVIQGPEWTWVVPEGEAPTRETAVMILHRNVPVEPGIADLMVRGWRPARVAGYDTFSVRLVRGDRDREVAGRTAHHYRLRSVIERTGSLDGSDQRYAYEADLWVLPDLPHSWAPFGFATHSLPALAPRLRDSLDVRLSELGLVGRAVIHMDFATLGDGAEAGGSEQTTAFQISDIEPTDPPPAPGPAVDRSVMERMETRLLEDPGTTCGAAAEGEIARDIGEVDPEARPAILATINDGCGSPELYFGMLEDRLEEDPDALCSRIRTAEDPEALAEAVFTEVQREAFMEFVPEAKRIGFHGELKRYCRGRGDG